MVNDGKHRVYQIQYPNGQPTWVGLFASQPAAQAYAGTRGWTLALDSMVRAVA